MQKRLLHSRAILCLVALFVGLFSPVPGHAHEPLPTLQSGVDLLVVYDKDLRPVRRIANLPPLVQCAAFSHDSFLIYPNATNVAQFHDATGRNTSNVPLSARAVRMVRTDKGFIYVLDTGPFVELDSTGALVASINAPDAAWADKLPSGRYVVVSRGGELRLYEVGTDQPLKKIGSAEAGRPVEFAAVAVLQSSQIVTFDAKSKELVWFDFELQEQARKPFDLGQPAIFASLAGQRLLIANSAQEQGLRFLNSDQSVATYKTQLLPVCAAALPDGAFVVGYTGKGNVTLINSPFDDIEGRIARLTPTCLFAIVVYALVGATLFSIIWIRLVTRFKGRTGQAEGAVDEVTAPTSDSYAKSRPSLLSNWFAGLSVLIVLGGLYVAWWSYPGLMDPTTPLLSVVPVPVSWLYFLAAWAASGVSMVYLGKRFSLAPRLRPLSNLGLEHTGRNQVFWLLVILSIGLSAVANYINIHDIKLVNTPEVVEQSPRIIVACWIAAQVLIVMAVSRVGAPSWLQSCGKVEVWSVIALCGIALLSRILWLEHYPHNIHHDFGVMGHHIYRYLLEPWYPFFRLDGGEGVGRPWYMQMAGLLWLFGVHDWSLRLSSVIWSVGFVLASYLIGRETVSHRFGLIFGALVCAQHNLLQYSRCPYVTESTAPFLFCLFYLCRGFRAQYARDFAIAGVWAGWSVMTVRNFTPFPFIGATLLVFFCLAYSRRMWMLRWQILLMFVASMVVFGPFVYFYLFQQTLPDLLASMSPLFVNHKLSTDLGLWLEQFKRAFGGFIVYPDRISWNMETLAPICVALTSALFGVGMITLLGRLRSVGAAMVLITIVVDTILGSAFLEYPPSYYHVFVAIVFAMYLVAIPIEFLWQLSDRIRVRIIRAVGSGCVATLAIAAVVEEVWPFIVYSTPTVAADGVAYPKYDTHTFLARYILEHRDRRFIAVSRPGNLYEFHSATIAILYGEFSERFELMADINLFIPVRPGPIRRATTFFIDQAVDLEKVRAVYPSGTLESFTFSDGQRSIMAYTVSGEEIERVWAEESKGGPSPRLEPFKLTPS